MVALSDLVHAKWRCLMYYSPWQKKCFNCPGAHTEHSVSCTLYLLFTDFPSCCSFAPSTCAPVYCVVHTPLLQVIIGDFMLHHNCEVYSMQFSFHSISGSLGEFHWQLAPVRGRLIVECVTPSQQDWRTAENTGIESGEEEEEKKALRHGKNDVRYY